MSKTLYLFPENNSQRTDYPEVQKYLYVEH
jgi:hypothetical protein